MQIEPFLDAFGPENVLIAFSERLGRRSQKELERICRFLGYSSRPRWDESIGRQNARNQHLRPSKLRNILVNAPVLSTIRRRYVPKEWHERLQGIWRISRQPKPRLSAASLACLRETFDADLERLGRWLDSSPIVNCLWPAFQPGLE